VLDRFVYISLVCCFNGEAQPRRRTVLLGKILRHLEGSMPGDRQRGRVDIVFTNLASWGEARAGFMTLDLPLSALSFLVNRPRSPAEGEIINMTPRALAAYRQDFAARAGLFAGWKPPEHQFFEPELSCI
jgi:hypothetical protein